MPREQRKETEVRVGIVGLGLAAMPHAKGYASHPNAEIVAVCDSDEFRARDFAGEHNVSAFYGSLDEMLRDAAVNAVDIATPTHLHAGMARAAAVAGKHVHCEKPFCRSAAEGEAACRAARDNGVALAVGETYVFLSSHRKARELIEAGEIGRPMQIRQRHGGWLERDEPAIPTGPSDRGWRVDPNKSGGGRFPWIFDHAVHFFASAEFFLLGEPVTEVYALAADEPPGIGRTSEGRTSEGRTSEGRTSNARTGASHDPYTSAEPDIPLLVWKHGDGRSQGLWTRAERLNNRYDFMRGFSTTIVGEHGMIEVLGEGGGGLVLENEPQHLVLHQEGKQSVGFRFDEGSDDVWESEICYYSQGHINQIPDFVDSVIAGTTPRYSGEDGVRAVRCTLAAILSATERRPVHVEEIPSEFVATMFC